MPGEQKFTPGGAYHDDVITYIIARYFSFTVFDMQQLFQLFLGITLMKKGPQDAPYSLFLFAGVLTGVFVLDLIGLNIPGPKGQVYDLLSLLRYWFIANAVVFLAMYLIFIVHGHRPRYLQSITALTGAEFIMKAIHLPVHLMIVFALESGNNGLLLMGGLLQMIWIGWLLMVYVHVFRQAIGASMFYALAIALGLFSLTLFLRPFLLPEVSS